MLFKFQKIVGCIEPWVKNRDTNRIVSLCIVTALVSSVHGNVHRIRFFLGDWVAAPDPSSLQDKAGT